MQNTLKKDVFISGIGLHSGIEAALVLRAAPADSGIVFVRTDVTDRDNKIAARWDNVRDSRLCTVIGNDAGVTVGTIEHLMAALRGCGVDNAVVELDGPEVPIMDGSSAPFVGAIDRAGLETQDLPRRAIKILRDVSVTQDGKSVSLSRGTESLFRGTIDFSHPAIGRQDFEVTLVNGNFRHDLAESRTFGFVHEVDALRRAGLALGGSLKNAIVLDENRVMNEEGLRREDEFIRHKLLDAVGDLYLAGGMIIGTYTGDKASHGLNNALLRKLFSTPGAWMMVDVYGDGQQENTAVPARKAVRRPAVSA